MECIGYLRDCETRVILLPTAPADHVYIGGALPNRRVESKGRNQVAGATERISTQLNLPQPLVAKTETAAGIQSLANCSRKSHPSHTANLPQCAKAAGVCTLKHETIPDHAVVFISSLN
eukprot:GHVT01086512.1.p1 GENE.GHVT01086512.1~~GHVT01086512.1.p1  ORF type:complete len:119 (-),score=11.69 GHVT01086512.1:1225-1581(-)